MSRAETGRISDRDNTFTARKELNKKRYKDKCFKNASGEKHIQIHEFVEMKIC